MTRTTVRRHPERGAYDRATLDAILDEGLVAHVGFAGPDGAPVVIPCAYARDGDVVYVHGAAPSRFLTTLTNGAPLCLTVTLFDGLVLARSTFHHSMNYRSAMVFGTAAAVTDFARKAAALRRIVEHIVPGRTADAREPTPAELGATAIVALPLGEASAKIRTGPPVDSDADRALPVWAGVLPAALAFGEPVADGAEQMPRMPAYVRDYRRGRVRND